MNQPFVKGLDLCELFYTVQRFFKHVLNFCPTGDIQAVDWTGVPDYRLLMLTSGRVSHDGMSQVYGFRYGEDDGLQVLELPYAGDDLSMVNPA